MKSLIMQILHNNTEADDVLQDVLLQVWDRASRYSSEKGTLMTWLCTLGRRRAIDRLRQQIAYLRATDRYEVSCRSSKNANESHTVSAKHVVMISVRCCVSSWPGCRRISNGDPSGLFQEKSQREVSTLIDAPLGAMKRESNSVSKNSDAFGRLRDKVV